MTNRNKQSESTSTQKQRDCEPMVIDTAQADRAGAREDRTASPDPATDKSHSTTGGSEGSTKRKPGTKRDDSSDS